MAKKKSFTTSDLIQLRLQNQQISESKFKQPVEIVKWLGAIQAQDYPGAKWSIGLRLPYTTDDDIEKAIADRKIIRTWPMRGTLHFISAEDIRWTLALVAPRIIEGNAFRYKQLDLTNKILDQSKNILIKALQGGKQLTRAEITEELKSAGIKADGVQLSHILQRAGLDQLICYGKRRGKQFTFTLLDEWTPESKILDKEEALAELTKRYFNSRGPATLQDYTWWSGLKAADARAGLEMIKSKLVQKYFGDKTYWMPEPRQVRKSSGVFLLPGFDEYMVSYKDRSFMVKPEYVKQINTGGGILYPTIVINGKVAGLWKREFKNDKVMIKTKFFYSITNKEKNDLVDATGRYGEFQALEVELIKH